MLFLLSCQLTFGASFDNILKVIFYSPNDTSYVILHESFFHPTSGSYEKGNMRTQGYTSSRISVYNLDSGNLLAQKKMGIMDSTEACFILGCSTNNLWIYCNKYKSGLQSLNPLTLEKNISQATIYKSLNISIGRFYEPEWQDISNYYGFDEVQQKLIVSNTKLQQYYIDAVTFATQPINDKVNLMQEFNNYLSESAKFNDSIWTLSGYDNTEFKCGNFTATKPSYLYGQFILEQNKVSLFKHFWGLQETINIEKSNSTKASKNIESLISGKKPDEVLMQTSKNSFYILSKKSTSPDAFIKISKVKSEQFGFFEEIWSTSPSGMFYNISQARNTKKFKQFFGNIFPEFSYQFIQAYNDKLLVIFLSYICCIDSNTGEILWQFKLR